MILKVIGETLRNLWDLKQRSSENVNKSVDFLKHWTMRKSRYGEAEGGEFKLEANESFFRY